MLVLAATEGNVNSHSISMYFFRMHGRRDGNVSDMSDF